MKKFIQLCSVLSLVVVFMAVSAQAQAVKRFETQVPFDFNVGQKSFKAGKYVLRLTNSAPRVGALTLEDPEGNILATTMIQASGEVSEKVPELVFARYDDQRFLTQLRTPDIGYTLSPSGSVKQVAGKNRRKGTKKQVSSVVLSNR